VEALRKRVGDDIPFIRAHTAIALSEIGDASAMADLEKLAHDRVPRVAQISSKALDLLKELSERR